MPVTLIRSGGEQSCQAQGLVDTGGAISCISSALVERLELEPVGKETIITIAGRAEGLTYFLDVVFPVNIPGSAEPGNYTILRLPCLAFDEARSYEFLIGWDLLAATQISINGLGRQASICF